ncbi:AREG protein, partial [Amia calva]|nr:AREG protein [Amia calva]
GKPKRKGKGKRKNKSKGEKNDKSTREKERQEKEKDTTPDPCATTHLDYCIHGHCKYMEELKEATCICLKGYDGERCGIQLLKTKKEEEMKPTDITQMVLVIIAVVLSLISFTAILLIICAHYRTHKNFIANYLGTSSEKEKLRQDGAHIVV